MSTKFNSNVHIKVSGTGKYCRDLNSKVMCDVENKNNIDTSFTLFNHIDIDKIYVKGNGRYAESNNPYTVGKWCRVKAGLLNRDHVKCNSMHRSDAQFTIEGDENGKSIMKFGSKYCSVHNNSLICGSSLKENATKFEIETDDSNQNERCLYQMGSKKNKQPFITHKMSLNDCKEVCVREKWHNCMYATFKHPRKFLRNRCMGHSLSDKEKENFYDRRMNRDTGHTTTLFFKDDKHFQCLSD